MVGHCPLLGGRNHVCRPDARCRAGRSGEQVGHVSSGQAGPAGRPDGSMTLITEMMERPLDPGYAAAAETRRKSGLPPATGHRSPILVVVAVLIGGLLAISALALRVPETGASRVKTYLVSRIEAMRGHAEAQTRLIATVRREVPRGAPWQ